MRDAPPLPAWVPCWVVCRARPGLARHGAGASPRPEGMPATLPAWGEGRRGSALYTEVPLEWEAGGGRVAWSDMSAEPRS